MVEDEWEVEVVLQVLSKCAIVRAVVTDSQRE